MVFYIFIKFNEITKCWFVLFFSYRRWHLIVKEIQMSTPVSSSLARLREQIYTYRGSLEVAKYTSVSKA